MTGPIKRNGWCAGPGTSGGVNGGGDIVRLSEGLALIDGAMWSAARARKPGRCRLTGAEYPVGTQIYRPIGNGNKRMQRVLASEVDKAPLRAPDTHS